MEDMITIELKMPKALYELVKELANERNTECSTIILDSVYTHVLTTLRMEKNLAWKKSDTMNKEMQRKYMDEIIATAKSDGFESVIYPLG